MTVHPKRSPDSVSSAELVAEHAELVKRIAYHLAAKMPPHVDVDDLIQAGMIGLLNAAESFSSSRGASFSTYAGIRIRGAMLDEARKASFAPRSAFRNARQVADVMREIENDTGRDARGQEVADKLGVTLEEYHKMLESAVASRLLSLEQLTGEGEEILVEPGEAGPFETLQEEEFRRDLARAIDGLPEREKLVLSLYYEQQLNLREIGEVLGVGESRVCQIHGQAVVRLRARLGAWLEPSQ